MPAKRGIFADVNWPTVIKGAVVLLSGVGLTGGVFYSASAPEANATTPSAQKFEIHEAVDSVNRIEINKKLDRVLTWIEAADKRLGAIEVANARIEGKLE